MKLGKLDRRIAIQRKTETLDTYGQPIPTWEQIGSQRWASRYPVSGSERFIADQFVANEQIEFQIQWSRDLSSLSPMDRIVYVTYDITTSPSDPVEFEYYEIIAVHEIGRREGFRIITVRRTETFQQDFEAGVVEADVLGVFFGNRHFGGAYFGDRFFG
jgi:SPP1 family predicted phage head-tail adaptor